MGNRLKKNVPVLRFPEFEGDWKQLTLKEITSKITDGTHDTPKPVSSGFAFF
jgi:type I restriction enzyme S subunit